MKRYRSEMTDGRLTLNQINEALKYMATRNAIFRRVESYYTGENMIIKQSERRDGRRAVPVPYGRRIVNTVTGYMFRPGYIGFSSENEAYKEQIDDVYYVNHEELITSQLGKQVSIFGVAYELHYVGEDTDGRAVPKFTVVPPEEMLSIYSFAVGDDTMIAAIRWYTVGDVEYVDVYYPDVIESYTKTKSGSVIPVAVRDETNEKKSVNKIDQHFYGRVPVVEYENNHDRTGDYQHVIPLIDSYDILLSDTIHEVEKLAEAYLVLTNATMDDDDVTKMRRKRILELYDNGKAEFLVKNVDPGLLTFARDWLRKEIHIQAQVPDMTDEAFGGQQSGIAIRYKLNDLENLCATKQALFERGLYDRLRLIDTMIDILYGDRGGVREIDITFTRNVPANYVEIAQIVQALRGNVSLHTILSELVPFVTNADEEIEKLEMETDPYYGATTYADVESGKVPSNISVTGLPQKSVEERGVWAKNSIRIK
jgi:SPP1 family phage portal protein